MSDYYAIVMIPFKVPLSGRTGPVCLAEAKSYVNAQPKEMGYEAKLLEVRLPTGQINDNLPPVA